MEGLLMPTWLPVALQIAVPIFILVMSAVVSFKIKFSDSRDLAAKELSFLALRVVVLIIMALSVAGHIYDLYVELSSTDPLTRSSVYYIANDIAGIFFTVTLVVILFVITSLCNLISSKK